MININKYESEPIFIQLREKFPEHPVTIITEPSALHDYVYGHAHNRQLIFRGCVFTYPFEFSELLEISGANDILGVNFKYCLFEDIVSIRRIDIGFQVFMSDICFNSGMDILNAHFRMIFSLKQTVFKSNFFILGATFDSSVVLDTVSANRIEIARSDFNKELSCLIFKDVSEFRIEGINVRRLNFHTFIKTHLVLIDISISDFFKCYDMSLEGLNINGLSFLNGYLLAGNLNVERINRETSRLIKHEAYRANNQILGIEYKVREMNEYMKEVRHWKTASTYLLLLFNRWSNNFGKSWTRGILFTVVCWVLFYGTFVVLRDIVGNQSILSTTEYIKEFVNYLWLLNGLSGLLDDTGNTCWWLAIVLVVVFVLGKILIGYGIYQTIAAFRRLSK